MQRIAGTATETTLLRNRAALDQLRPKHVSQTEAVRPPQSSAFPLLEEGY